jgi:surface protein
MEPNTINKSKEQLLSINSNNKLKELKSDFFLRILFKIIPKKKALGAIKYNKYLQKRINININNYKVYSEEYSSVEIEIIPKENEYKSPFINFTEDRKYFHIYFNDDKTEELRRANLIANDKVSKINIIIDHQVKSFYKLFNSCKGIISINFKYFFRNNITNMSYMFNECSSLKELNLTNFNTINVTKMDYMFHGCSSLNVINLTNFNTNNVTDMNNMFFD